MKKTFNTLDIIQAIFGVVTILLAIFIFISDNSYWSLKIVFILLALNLIIMGSREFKRNKKIAYFSFAAALLIIFLQF